MNEAITTLGTFNRWGKSWIICKVTNCLGGDDYSIRCERGRIGRKGHQPITVALTRFICSKYGFDFK